MKNILRSLRFKCYFTTILAVALLSFVSISATCNVHARTLETRYGELRTTVAKIASGMFDVTKSDSYINGEDSEEHIKNNIRLRELTDDISDINVICIYKFTPDGIYTIFDTGSSEIRGGVGSVAEYSREWETVKDKLLSGETIEELSVHFTEGRAGLYCMPAGAAADGGQIYICTGVLDSLIEELSDAFLAKTAKGIGVAAILFLILTAVYVELKVIRPINNIAALVERACKENDSALLDEMVSDKQKSVGEIEKISRSLVKIYSTKIKLNSVISKAKSNHANAIVSIIKCMDNFYAMHLDNSAQYMILLTSAMRQDAKFKDRIPSEDYENLLLAEPFHDIGKLVIPGHILNKPAALTTDEYEVVKQHTTLGAKIVDELNAGEAPEEYMEYARQIALCHHERWDGTGYPAGLKGTEIPLFARIVAVVDVFDAIVSKRVYKEAYSFDYAFNAIVEGRGTAFDPDIVDVFVSIKSKVYDLYSKINNR